MSIAQPSRRQSFSDILLYSILFLFFIQLLVDFVAALYATALVRLAPGIEVAAVVFFFSPLALLLLRRGLAGKALVLVGMLALICRLVEPLLPTRGRLLVAGLGVACWLVFFPALLWNQKREAAETSSLNLGIGLTFGVSLAILFRALDSGLDLSTDQWYQSIGWILGTVAAVLLLDLAGLGRAAPPPVGAEPKKSSEAGDEAPPASPWKISGLSLGMAGALLLLYFAFTSPNVIVRWTGFSYLLVLSVILVTLCLFILFITRQNLLAWLSPALVAGWNFLFILALTATILFNQTRLPSNSGDYPFPASELMLWQQIPLACMLVLFPVIFLDFILYTRQMIAWQPTMRSLGWSFALGGLFLLVMILAQVFTTVYDYVPLVGPLFRDKFWLVFLVAGLALALPLWLVGKDSYQLGGAFTQAGATNLLPGIMILISLAALTGASLATARPAPQPAVRRSLRVLTYNIQQGYDAQGQKNYAGQLEALRAQNADLIGLQESDTNRIAGGNADLVRYFADNLELYSYYGPKTVDGTFGIVLLSKYPIQNPRTVFLYSRGEQTAAIEARITAGERTFFVMVTHLGNDGPMIQLEQVLQRLEEKKNVLVMGDFNFRPDTDQYRLANSHLDDAWLVNDHLNILDQGLDPDERIDYLFVLPGTSVDKARYLTGPQSDHPAFVADLEW